jgi:NADH dehydrogenase FAD-containing subunit
MTHRIVVLGAGYAGLVTARRLANEEDVRVTLVNASDRFVERVRLHQVAAGHRLPDRPLHAFADKAELVVDTVTAVDADERTVHLTGTAIRYDTLVYALGSRADTPADVHTVATYDDAVRLRDALRNREKVTVVGGGLTGIETAAELAATHDVDLMTTGVVAPGVGERGRRYLRARLARLGVTVHEGQRVEEGERKRIVVWTAGFRVPGIAAEAAAVVAEHQPGPPRRAHPVRAR